jgi:hypothetical protein
LDGETHGRSAVVNFQFGWLSKLDGDTLELDFCEVCAEKLGEVIERRLVPNLKPKFVNIIDLGKYK